METKCDDLQNIKTDFLIENDTGTYQMLKKFHSLFLFFKLFTHFASVTFHSIQTFLETRLFLLLVLSCVEPH